MDYVYEDFEQKDVEEIVCFFVEYWKQAQIQAGDVEGQWWPLYQMGQNIARNHEFFIYRNEETARSWQQLGRTDQNDKDMVHVLWGDTLTIVCGSDEVMSKLKEHIEKKRGDRVAQKFIALKIQREHARYIRSQVKQSILGWFNGTLHNHPTEQMAKTFDVELHPPRFLKRLLKGIDEIDLESED